MKICVVSDIHMEIGGFPGNTKYLEGDVLVIAGDLTCAGYFSNSPHVRLRSTEYSAQQNNMEKMKRYWFPKFKRVFYIMGNHEHYGFDVRLSARTMAAALSCVSNLKVLDNEAVMFDGVMFIGSTLWTNFNNGDAYDMGRAELIMNDYRRIFIDGGYFCPLDVLDEHKKSLTFIEQTLKDNLTTPTVMITHHGPSLRCQNTKRHGNELTHAYCSDLEYLAHDNPQIRLWCSGHTHDSMDFTVNQTRFVSNQRGYAGYEVGARLFKPRTYEISL